jgi:Amt family ammonium transporter
MSQFLVQLAGVAAAAGWSVVATFVIVKVITVTIGLRVSKDEEIEGLDFTAHGEKAYNP